jgi:hypothetical protein
MSFTVEKDGSLLVLDQVNGRLVRFGARGPASIPVSQRAPQDVAVAPDGSLAVLDRLGDRSVALLGPEGQVRGELPIEGPSVREGGGVTGVFVDGHDVYVEREHGQLVRVGDTDGHPDPTQPTIPGRPSRNGLWFLLAGLVDARAGRAYLTEIDRATSQNRFTRELDVGEPLWSLVLLDSDLAGTIYVGFQVAEGLRLACVDGASGEVTGEAELPASPMPEESFRDLVALDQGGVLYAYRTEQGQKFLVATCR